jgi:hypothetical protein
MPNDSMNAKNTDRGNNPGQASQPSGADESNNRPPRTTARQDKVDIEQDEDQPEIPKVGSLDAPGG